jgi:NADH-quinone oxidoreductase subunit A
VLSLFHLNAGIQASHASLTFTLVLGRFLKEFPTEFKTIAADMLEQYIPIGIMMILAVAFGLFLVNINRWIGPRRPSEEKLSTYESGMEPVKSARERFSVKFYLVAVLFIIFDIEIVFMYPWAVQFRSLGLFGYVEMLVFIAILLVGYLYILKKGALQWD